MVGCDWAFKRLVVGFKGLDGVFERLFWAFKWLGGVFKRLSSGVHWACTFGVVVTTDNMGRAI